MFSLPSKCEHIEKAELISAENIKFFNPNMVQRKSYNSLNQPECAFFLCLICGEIFPSKNMFQVHFQKNSHILGVNLLDLSVWCWECSSDMLPDTKGNYIKFNVKLRLHLQYLMERKYKIPFYRFFNEKQIYGMKYNIFVNKEDKRFMKRKELKNLAKKVAQCEYILQTSDDYNERE